MHDLSVIMSLALHSYTDEAYSPCAADPPTQVMQSLSNV